MDSYPYPRDKVHLWIGTSFASEDAYLAYFEIDYAQDAEVGDPDYQPCPFCRDLGLVWYDEDFIGVLPRLPAEEPVERLLEASAVDASEWPQVLARCTALGIERANALVWYNDASVVLSEPIRPSYNGLQYIGLFEGD